MNNLKIIIMGCTCTKLPKKEESVDRRHQYSIEKDPSQPAPTKILVNKKAALPVRPLRPQWPSHIYLNPSEMAQMAYKDELHLMKELKDYKIKRELSGFRGYQCEPEMRLSSGKVVETEAWNPLTYGLVQGKQELVYFITK